jgi:UDP-N-acetylglucosamine 3-dehydrogenase
MNRSKVRIAILGAGAMGKAHAAAYATLAGVELIDVPARDGKRVRAMLESPDIDAVDICLPSALHARFAIPALEHGKHVFCETPMALDLGEALAMRDAARKAGRLLQVGLLVRSIGSYRHVKEIAERGVHGRLLGLTAWRLGSYLRPDAPDYKTHHSEPTTELMTFDFDFASWLLGKPDRISASGIAEMTALLGYDAGRHATIIASGLMPTGTPFTVGFRVLFEDACFELLQVFRGGGPPDVTFTLTEGRASRRPVALQGANPFETELRRFVDCIAGRADPELLDADRALEALRLSLATQQALAQGAPVAL